MADASPAVRLENCTRRFGSVTAVDGLSFTVGHGEIFGLIGPDGAGKTTTLRMMSGLVAPEAGEIWVDGHPVHRTPGAIKDSIGYMAQRFGMYADLTVAENLAFYADLFGIDARERDRRVEPLMAMTRMAPFRDRAAGKLSGGMKQKLALMCSLLHRPRVLLLDEPTNGVDPVSRRDFWTILYQLVREGLTVVLATAYLDEAERCSRVAMLYQGRLIRSDTPARLRLENREQCWAATGERLREARPVLAATPGVVSVEPSGAELHLFADPAAAPEERLLAGLRQAGFAGIALRPIVPSVEDVFIAEIRKAERMAEPAR